MTVPTSEDPDSTEGRTVEHGMARFDGYLSTACLTRKHGFCRNPSKENRLCECTCHQPSSVSSAVAEVSAPGENQTTQRTDAVA